MKAIRYYRFPDIINESNVEDLSESVIVNCVGIDVTEDYFNTVRPQGRKDTTLIYVLEGSICFESETGESKTVGPEMGIILRKNRKQNYFSADKTTTFAWIHFTGHQIEAILDKFEFTHEFIFEKYSAAGFMHLFDKISKEFMLKRYDYIYYSSLYLQELLLTLRRDYMFKNTSLKYIEKSLEYINNNYLKDISIGDLAELEGMSVSYYRKLFIEKMNVSPKQYITSLKISYAISQLHYTNAPTEKIARQCGFNDLKYFHRVFKKSTGVTPKNCRESKNRVLND